MIESRSSVEFSVIVPTRGSINYIRAALSSALANDVDLEVIVAHDRRNGEDAIPGTVVDDHRIRLVESLIPGLPAARNAAIDVARGVYLALLDDDDLWSITHLRDAREVLRDEPAALLVASACRYFHDGAEDDSTRLPHDWQHLPGHPAPPAAGRIQRRALLRGNLFVAPAVTLVREHLGAERFAVDLASLEDYEMWLRLSRCGRLLYDPRPSVAVRLRRDSMSTNWRRMAECEIEVLRREQAHGIPSEEMTRAEFDARIGRLHHELSYAHFMAGDHVAARAALATSHNFLPHYWKYYAYRLGLTVPALGRLIGQRFRPRMA